MSQRPGLQFSHVGFFVTDLEQQLAFYSEVLELTLTDRGILEGPHGPMQLAFLSRDPDEHHQVVLISGRPVDVPFNVINQISFKADSLQTLIQFHRRLEQSQAREILPVTHGNALSVYCRDPEGNRLELYVDTPWYVSQPCRVAAPFDLPEDELLAWAERHARTLPGFRPRSQWRQDMARKMGLAD